MNTIREGETETSNLLSKCPFSELDLQETLIRRLLAAPLHTVPNMVVAILPVPGRLHVEQQQE